jgi:hypothetical protein
MLVACRLAGLSALEAHYAGLIALNQSGALGRRTAIAQPSRLRTAFDDVHEPAVEKQHIGQ